MTDLETLKREVHHKRRMDIADAIKTLRSHTKSCGNGVSHLGYNYCADMLQPYVEEVDECLERALNAGAINRRQYERLYARYVE